MTDDQKHILKLEAAMLKDLLEGQTVIVVTVSKFCEIEIEQFIRIDKVEDGMFVTTDGTYTGNRRGLVDYKARSITFRTGLGASVKSRTFTVMNLGGNVGSKYRPYPEDEKVRELWLNAERASWTRAWVSDNIS